MSLLRKMSDRQVTFFVKGVPVPQGSKNVSRWGNVYDANHATLKPWRAQIAKRASETERYFTGPVSVQVEFVLPRPKTVTRPHPIVKPDLDKLLRACFDGLHCSGYKLLQDDSIIVSSLCCKRYQTPDEPTGAFITVLAL